MPRLTTLEDRLLQFELAGDCWEWSGRITPDGYGALQNVGGSQLAHRAMYEYAVGPVPPGLQVDHLCRNRACVNVDHMEVVTQRENVLRGESPLAHQKRQTHCKRGHPLDSENLIIFRNAHGYESRRCRTCTRDKGRENMRRYRAEKKAEGR